MQKKGSDRTYVATFEDLFDLGEIQNLQDLFAKATGVACQILRPDGTFITERSNYCRLCGDIIRGCEKGLARCTESDTSLGKITAEGLNIYRCGSAGLLEAGAPIYLEGRHIATWGLGQVSDGTQTEAGIRDFAREIGADEDAAANAFRDVTVMSRERFEDVARMMHAVANQLTTIGYQNVQQAALIEQQRQTKEDLARFQWLLEKESDGTDDPPDEYVPPYSDVTELNTRRVILDAVGTELLASMASDLMDLLDTSVAVYEANGDYAYGVFTSSWCRVFDTASFRLCETGDTKAALQSGKWLCHECCWNESARAAIESGEPTDIECVGGIRLYAVPIRVEGEIAGVINIGYGTPPRDDARLQELTGNFGLDIDDVRRASAAYRPRPQYIIDAAKRRGRSVAHHIGEIVERKGVELALVREQERRELASDAAHLGIWDLDLKRNELIWDDRMFQLYGVESETFGAAYEYWQERIHPEDLERSSREVDQAIAGEKPFDTEFRVVYPDGSVRHLKAYATVSRDDQGTPIRMTGANYDITERKEAEGALQRERDRLDYVLKAGRLGTWVWNIRENSAEFNEMWATLLGHTMDEIGPASYELWKSLGHPDDVPKIEKLLQQCASGETEDYSSEFRMRHKDGHWVWILDRGQVMTYDTEGRPLEMFGTHADITPLKLAEEELRQSEAKFRSYVEQAPFGLFIADERGRYVDTNPAAARITGYSRDELLKMNLLDMLHPDGGAAGAAHFTQVAEQGIADGILPYVRKDGTCRLWSVTAVRLSTERFLGFVQDVTEREQMEKQVRAAQKLDAIGQLAGGVAHDFNNLLMGIMGYTDLCLENIEEEHPIREWLDEIMQEAKRSADIVRQLLAFSRKQTIAPRVLDLNDTVEHMLKMLRSLIGEDIDLLWQPGRRLAPVSIDPGQIDQILANLCINARDAIGGVGKIEIETANRRLDEEYCATHAEVQPGDFVMLAVSDSGVGMDAETQASIFEPFFTTKAEGEGTGLGLSTVYGIVKQNGGSISVYSEPGEGTTFRIYLPCCECTQNDADVQKIPSISPGGSETLLVVEDQQAICKIIRKYLEPLGYTVYTAESPARALEIMDESGGDIELLITDVVMPGMNGRELAEKLQETKPELHVLYMSGYTANVIAHRGILEEGVNFISKPITRVQLAEKLRDILG